MNLATLVEHLDGIHVDVVGDPEGVELRAATHNSSTVQSEDLFCCVVGQSADGHDFAADAVGRGAAAILCSRRLDLEVPQVIVDQDQLRTTMARCAHELAGNPANDLVMIGVTGTNGKTTVTQLLGSIAQAAGFATEVIGTLTGARTTPESTELAPRLAALRDRAAASGQTGLVAMEVSSHALALNRVDGIRFAVGGFTNLSHDHLDFHRTMEEYFAAKQRLFESGRSAKAVIWTDDPYGERLAHLATGEVISVGIDAAESLTFSFAQSSFVWQGRPVTVPMAGRVNVANALMALAIATAVGIDPDVAVAAIGSTAAVPGRLEIVPSRSGAPTVIVDYAHTPTGLETVLDDLRRIMAGNGELWVVFGCGGDRDATKRPLMGEVGARAADHSVVTSDNPRSEDPSAIIAAIMDGVPSHRRDKVTVIADRRAGIAYALSQASADDVVLIAGKGHERTQDIATGSIPFSDVEVAGELLAEWRHA